MGIRKLKITTLHGDIETPAFLPDATYGSINSISFDDATESQVREIVTTTLHLELKLGADYIQEFGGLHKFFNWNRPILTDSGGFQVFSLVHRRGNRQNRITDQGAEFVDLASGKRHLLTPESSQAIQAKLGSDIRVVLDEPLALGAGDRENIDSVRRTLDWAKRSHAEFLSLSGTSAQQLVNTEIADGVYRPATLRPLLTAVVQGAHNYDLRKRSAEGLIDLGFDGFNYGGLPLKDSGELDLDLSQYLVGLLPEKKIRYAMGIGTPDDIVSLSHMGWDLFDCVLPTRNARHGYLYVQPGEGDKEFKHYSVLHLKSERYKFADQPISSSTHPLLKNVSRAYLRHLIRIGEPAGFRLATIHNLHFYSQLMQRIRAGEL